MNNFRWVHIGFEWRKGRHKAVYRQVYFGHVAG